jgi:hypothetical protein
MLGEYYERSNGALQSGLEDDIEAWWILQNIDLGVIVESHLMCYAFPNCGVVLPSVLF